MCVAIECRIKLTHLKRGAGGGAGAEISSPAAAPVIVDEAKAAPASAAPAPPAADPGIERWLDDGASMVCPVAAAREL